MKKSSLKKDTGEKIKFTVSIGISESTSVELNRKGLVIGATLETDFHIS